MLPEAGFPAAARACCQKESTAMAPNSGAALAHFKIVLRCITTPKLSNPAAILTINRLEFLHDVLVAMPVAGQRTFARAVEVDTNPTFIADAAQNLVTGGKIDV